MKHGKENTGRYFQTVARFFLEQRGAPFFLSSQEVEIIAGWQKAGVPVKIVLQGIRDSFESRRRRPGRRSRALSLALCQSFVQKAFEAYKERKVGGKRKPSPARDKRKAMKRAISLFLESCPEGIPEIKQVYSRVQRRPLKDMDESMLEVLEQEVEALLIQQASEEEKKRIRQETLQAFAGSNRGEIDRISDLKLAKYMREKHKIPHLSLFYYY